MRWIIPRALAPLARALALVVLLAITLTPAWAQGGDGPNPGVHVAPPDGPYTVYLTFDDGPSSSVTPLVLDILAEYDVPGTFFLHGHRIADNEGLVRRMVEDGHAIGNHLWQQDGLTAGSGVSESQLRASWQRTEDEIARALGPELAAVYAQQPVYLIRQPGGSARPFPVPEGVVAITYNWHVSSGDSAPWNPGPGDPPTRPWNYVVGNVVLSWFEPFRYYSVYEYGDGAIILMHDVSPVLPQALPSIIEDLLENGASFGVLPRPGDNPGSMPVLISAPPEWYLYNDPFPGTPADAEADVADPAATTPSLVGTRPDMLP
ncbi:MAG: polysaccharide deacetylase family protein [Chloroflexi bacterium]|nr:polysaccharide deacetylase family protein [Chloroflexota bacterium]